MKKIFGSYLTYIIIAIFIVSIAYYFMIDTKNISEKKVINIGIEPWPGFLLIPLADKLGYFNDEGLDVRYKIYEGYTELENDYFGGKLDGRSMFASDVIDTKNIQKSLEQIIFITDYSLGGDGLISRKSAPDIRTVKRPRIGITYDVDFFLLWILKDLSLEIKNVDFVRYDTEEDQLSSFIAGKIDYIVTYDPYLSDAIYAGGKYEYSSADDPGVITDVIGFKKSFIDSNTESINAFTRAYFKAYDYWLKNQDNAYLLVSKDFGIGVADFKEQMKKLQLFNLDDNNTALSISVGLKSIYANLRIINMFLNNYDQSRNVTDVDSYVYPNAIRSLSNK